VRWIAKNIINNNNNKSKKFNTKRKIYLSTKNPHMYFVVVVVFSDYGCCVFCANWDVVCHVVATLEYMVTTTSL